MALNRDSLGKTYGPVVTEAHADRIAAYAEATGDSPVGRDGHVLAPPVFGVVPVWPAIQQALADDELGVDPAWVVHGEQRMTFHRLIRAGDRLTSTGTVSSIEERGANEVFVLSFETRDADGELVTAQDVVCVSRGTGGGKPADRPAVPPRPVAAAREPDLVRTVELPADITYRYARASGDDNAIHIDDELARSVGLPGIIVQGLCLFAIALQGVIELAAGADPRRVHAAAVRFARPLRPGAPLRTEVFRTDSGADFKAHGPDGKAALKGSATTA